MADRVLVGNVRGPKGDPGAAGAPGSPGAPGKDAVVDAALDENSTNAIQNAVVTKKLNEVFQSVSEGKALVASAITDKGVNTDASATFATMAGNISQIQTSVGSGIISTVSITKAQVNQAIASDSYSYEKVV